VELEVLDYGYVNLIEAWGSDERIVESARMSTGKGFRGWDADAKLLEYLWTHRHTSPFEQCGLTLEIQAPIFVFRQWHRHRTQSYSELSARYAQMPNEHYLPEPGQVRYQAPHNKQGSGDVVPDALAFEFLARMASDQERLYQTYQWALDQGISREMARLNTPVSRYSRMRASANLLNWLRFVSLRLG